MLFICYPKCSTCQKAKKFLEANNTSFTERNIKDNNPSEEELKNWYLKSNLPLNKFFNTSGLLYKEMKLKDKLASMSDEEKLKLLSSDGMLVKRPILIKNDIILVGFKEEDWKKII